MIRAQASGGPVRLLGPVILVIAVVLCAVFMPAMAMAALAGCVTVIGVVTLARRAPTPAQVREPHVIERAATPTFVMATGPPVPIPLRT